MKLQRETVVTVSLFFFLSLSVLFGLFLFPRQTETLSRHSSLVPPETAAGVASIVIDSSDAAFPIRLEKQDGDWYLQLDDTHRYPANGAKIERLLAELTHNRKMYTTGDEDGKAFGIDTAATVRMRLSAKDKTSLTDLDFGYATANGSQRYVRNSQYPSIFRTMDSFEPYLDLHTNAWADLDIFSTEFAKVSLQRVVYEKKELRAVFIAGINPEVAELEQTLKSLACLDITNLPLIPTETLYLEFGDTSRIQVGFAKLNEEYYILSNSQTGGMYIISNWTKERLDRALCLR